MKDFVLTPKRVVNIKNVSGLEAISTERDGGARIGTLVTLDRIVEASHIRQNYPALAQTVADAASPQIRNMATIGGNLCQRPAAGISVTEWACCQRPGWEVPGRRR